jgi:predicted membrane protein
MKETASIILLFITICLYSGAMNITATVIFIVIGGLLIYIAWLEDKKDAQRRKELVTMRKERLARRKLGQY